MRRFVTGVIVLGSIITGCGMADIEDREVHPVSDSAYDTAAFNAGRYQFPGETWMLHPDPSLLGWDSEKLRQVGWLADSLQTAAWMVIHKGVLVSDWGATDEKYITQSMRKGLLNSLYGIYEERGQIDLSATMVELDVTDTPPLTETERQANVEQLLQSTSGVYHSALYEEGSWKREKPERGAHKPGETWYYNNWGFNVLGPLFEQLTGQTIGNSFSQEVAVPLQMQDFEPEDVTNITRNDWTEWMMGNESDHSAYMFTISARDLARYGLLYLNRGSWNGNRIISEDWIDRSWDPVDIEMYYTLKFGYMWWIFEDGVIYVNEEQGFEDDIYFTSGNRGHALFVIPYLDLVVVHRVDVKGVDFWSQMKRGMLGIYADVDDDDVYRMLEIVRQAHPRYHPQGETE